MTTIKIISFGSIKIKIDDSEEACEKIGLKSGDSIMSDGMRYYHGDKKHPTNNNFKEYVLLGYDKKIRACFWFKKTKDQKFYFFSPFPEKIKTPEE